jgi:ribonuclease HI
MADLEKVQREAVRKITGALKSTPIDAIMSEAELPPLAHRAVTLATIAVERSMRAGDSNPRFIMMMKEQRRRLKKTCWRQKAVERWKSLFNTSRPRWKFPTPSKPWLSRVGLTIIPGGAREGTDAANLALAEKSLEDNGNFDLVVYTDGSAVEGNHDGGAGVVVTQGEMSNPRVLETFHVAAGSWCSSFQAELVGLREAMLWLEAHADEWQTARIATDSQSALMAWSSFRYNSKNNLLQELNIRVSKLLAQGKTVEATWIPSHCGVPGNELADAEAAKGAVCDQSNVGWLFDSAVARISAAQPPFLLQHERARSTYAEVPLREPTTSKAELLSFRRFRMGHSIELRGYAKRIGLAEEGECRWCGADDETSTHLVLQCAALAAERQLLGIRRLSDLSTKPNLSLAFWRHIRLL